MERRFLIAISCGIMSVTCLLFILSNALPMWGKTETVYGHSTVGLWKLCTSFLGQTVCGDNECDWAYDKSNQCIKLTFARSFMSVACVTSVLDVVFLVICLIQGTHTRPVFVRLAKGFPASSFVTGIVGTATGLAFVHPGAGVSIAASGIMAIIALVTNLVGIIITALIPVNCY